MPSAINIAEYMIIRNSKEDYGYEPLTLGKLQILCYYALGVYSKYANGKKLFEDNIIAVISGVRIDSVYNTYVGKEIKKQTKTMMNLI